MKIISSRKALSSIMEKLKDHANAGLLLSRFSPIFKDKSSVKGEEMEKLTHQLKKALQTSKLIYQHAYESYKDMMEQMGSIMPTKHEFFSTPANSRLAIGLGAASVLETGLTLNWTFGTPFIPGTGLKGLASHYCNTVWGEIDNTFKIGGENHLLLFGGEKQGTEKKGDGQTSAGLLIFNDAWITPDKLENSILRDVITPHHQDYNGGSSTNNFKAPTDDDQPIPVTYYSVQGTFLITLGIDTKSDDPKGKEWLDLGFLLLTEALEQWGIGGKTSSGYGRLLPKSKLKLGGGRATTKYPPSPQTKEMGKNYVPPKAPRTQPQQPIRPVGVNQRGKNIRKSFLIDKVPSPAKKRRRKEGKPEIKHTLDRSIIEAEVDSSKDQDGLEELCKKAWSIISNIGTKPMDLGKLLNKAGIDKDYDYYFQKPKKCIQFVIKAYGADDEYRFDSGGLKRK